MDPYRTLGVSRSCTRVELKEAFRARVASAHPDRGGDDAVFIQLRAAYERILAELDRRAQSRPEAELSRREAPGDGTTEPLASTPESAQYEKDETADKKPRPRPPDPAVVRKAYIAWLSHASAEADRTDPLRRGKWMRILGMGFLCYLIFGSLCWSFFALVSAAVEAEAKREQTAVVSNPVNRDVEAKPHSESPDDVPVGVLIGVLFGFFVPVLAACWIVWKFDLA